MIGFGVWYIRDLADTVTLGFYLCILAAIFNCIIPFLIIYKMGQDNTSERCNITLDDTCEVLAWHMAYQKLKWWPFLFPCLFPVSRSAWMFSCSYTGLLYTLYTSCEIFHLHGSISAFFSAYDSSPPSFRVHVLHVIHALICSNLGGFCRSVSRPQFLLLFSLFLIVMQPYIYCFSNHPVPPTSVSSSNCVFKFEPEDYLVHLYFLSLSLFFLAVNLAWIKM